jgi:hypothetical protein
MASDLGHDRKRSSSEDYVSCVARASCIVLCILSAILNVTLLNQHSVYTNSEQKQSAEEPFEPETITCASTNCTEVCIRAHYNDQCKDHIRVGFSNPKESQVSGIKAENLEDILLFIGIISGRGYRSVHSVPSLYSYQ